MNFPTDMSSPARTLAFEARSSPQGGQDLSFKRLLDEANSNSTQYAAGGVFSSPFASICPPSVPLTPVDQLRALLMSYIPTDVNAGRGFGLQNSDSPFNSSSQTSELSSSSSSSVPSSITSPCEESSLSFPSPGLSFHGLSMNDQDPTVPLQACQYPLDLSFSPNDQSYPTPPNQPLFKPVPLPEVASTADVPIMDQVVGINDFGAFPGSNSFLAVPPFSETTALGLYCPSTPQGFHIPPLSIQVDSSMLSALPTASPTETRKVRAVSPPTKASRTKRVRNGKVRQPSYVAAATFPSSASSTDKEGVLKCPICGFPQSTQRKGDFQRHLRTHQDAKLTRYVCCGVPEDHPAAGGLSPGHSVRVYKGREFYGGCGKSYARMDALQRHLGKSGCAYGSTKDHQMWRQLYF